MFPSRPTCLVLAGPSRHGLPDGLRRPRPGVLWLPPADPRLLDMLRRQRPEGTEIAIVDGFADGRDALPAAAMALVGDGFRVWDMGSTGALLARDLGPAGPRGFGRVWRMLEEDLSLGWDDLVTFHAPHPPYLPVSEPLIHFRAVVAAL